MSTESQVDGDGHVFDLREQHCPTCGPVGTRVIGLRGGEFHRYGQGVPSTIVQCVKCTLLFPNPFPIPRNANDLYGDPAKYFAAHDEAEKITLFRSLIRELKQLSGRPNPSLLDVGSGRGELLVAAKAEGLTSIVGLETTAAMIVYARETHAVHLIAQRIEEFARESTQRFDAVALSAVLEHVYDPDAMIAAVAELTTPGAIVYIDVPNEPNLLTRVGNLANRLRGSRAVYNLSPTFAPFHVYGFNPRALDALLSKHRFVLEKLAVESAGTVSSRPQWRDRMKALAATQVKRLSKLTRDGNNITAWARRV